MLLQAMRAFEGMGLRDVGRGDIMVDADGNPWVVEVNTSPGMTETSLLPMAAQAAGLAFPDLCDVIVRVASLARAVPADRPVSSWAVTPVRAPARSR